MGWKFETERKSYTLFDIALITVVFFSVVALVKYLWPDSIPFGFFEFWRFTGTWPGFGCIIAISAVWNAIENAIAARHKFKDDPEPSRNARGLFPFSLYIGIKPAVTEETFFRWILFYVEIIAFKMSNIIACGITGVLHNWIFGPFVNLVSFGFLEPWLFHESSWAVGAALIFSCGRFRDGHMYQGFWGWLCSWFFGLFAFYVMFNYGLPAAMTAHFAFNFTAVYAFYLTEKAMERWG